MPAIIGYMQESGSHSTILVATLVFLLIAVGGVAGWALYAYQQERTTVQEQIEVAVEEARQQQEQELRAEFQEERDNPFRTYTAPSVFGTLEVDFPASWNVYAEDSTSSTTQLDVFIHPEQVRRPDDTNFPHAFRLQLVDNLFEDATESLQSGAEEGELEARTITVSGIEGVRYRGELEHGIGSGFDSVLVALPYRDKTVFMWTEGESHRNDFGDILEEANIVR